MCKISIFGSCRQDAIYDYFNTSPIRNKLTYPHYSSEALQAIKYCLGQINIKDIETHFAFRSWIISKERYSQKKLIKDLKKTDLCIIEIATRKSYNYKNIYLHHISEEEEYGFSNKSKIKIHTMTDKEIESDIIKIKKLLYNKKIIIVTHFYTKETGPRYDLVLALKKIAKKHNIAIFDPVDQIGGIDKIKNLLVPEKILSHYTPAGHKKIGEKYVKFINKKFSIKPSRFVMIQNKIKKVCQYIIFASSIKTD